MNSPRQYITELVESERIDPESIPEALALAGAVPNKQDWKLFIDRLFLLLGGAALGVAAIFFIAYNWVAIGRFGKFALLELSIGVAVFSFCWFQGQKVKAQASLLFACLCLGALLALFGQTYQTGADPWQLFFTWSILIIPWTLIARFSALWVLWVVLINLSIILYQQTFRSVWWLMPFSETATLWPVFAFNTAVLLSWEWLATRWSWLAERWALRLIAMGSGIPITWLVLLSVFDGDANVEAAAVWLVWSAGIYIAYRKWLADLFMLAGACLVGIVLITAFMVRVLLEDFDAGGLLLLALLVIGLGAATAVWLKKLHREMQS